MIEGINFNIYTSYLYKISQLLKSGIVPIITVFTDVRKNEELRRFNKFPHIEKFFPSKEINKRRKETQDTLKFLDDYYYENLYNKNPDYFLMQMKMISDRFGGANVALIGLYADINECHRKVIANWLNTETGINIEEWDEDKSIFNEKRLYTSENASDLKPGDRVICGNSKEEIEIKLNSLKFCESIKEYKNNINRISYIDFKTEELFICSAGYDSTFDNDDGGYYPMVYLYGVPSLYYCFYPEKQNIIIKEQENNKEIKEPPKEPIKKKIMIEILDTTDKFPLQKIGKMSGVCWGGKTDDVEKNIKRAKDCII